MFSAPFAALEEAEISRRLAGLDDNSLAVARNYVRRCRNLERIKGSPFADGSRVLIDLDALKEHIMCFPSPHAELKTYQKIYGFKTGAEVFEGDVIGAVGESAIIEIADEPHLHLELTLKGEYIDPSELLDAHAPCVIDVP